MAEELKYQWTDNPTASGVSKCDTDVLNECLMHLKYDKEGGGGLEIGDIGIAPLGIDETKGKRRYLNGQLIIQDQYVQFANKVKSAVALYPSLACTESEWQATATMTVGGQVGKFVVDDEAGTIRLPKITMPIQGLTDLSKLGELVEAGLPNVTGTVVLNGGGARNPHIGLASPTGVFTSSTATGSDKYNAASAGNNATTQVNLNFNASNSNSIYGKSNTVQQEQIQYPYFIQVATGAETEDNIINEIELNNPYSFGDSKYSQIILNNISWLRSLGQWNPKIDYTDYYDWILTNANNGEELFKLSTEEYDDYCWVVNTAEETFRLPIKVKLASGKAVVGNGMVLGLTDGINNYSVGSYSTSGGDYRRLAAGTTGYGESLPTTVSAAGTLAANNALMGITTDSSKSGIETSDRDLYLYFYVGETVQNANLINAGRIEEKVASLIPNNSSLISGYAMPSSRYIDLTLGASGTTYTAPANGWFYIDKTPNAVGQYLYLYNQSKVYGVSMFSSTTANRYRLLLPVLKGDVIDCTYNMPTTHQFKFIYAEGEV